MATFPYVGTVMYQAHLRRKLDFLKVGLGSASSSVQERRWRGVEFAYDVSPGSRDSGSHMLRHVRARAFCVECDSAKSLDDTTVALPHFHS